MRKTILTTTLLIITTLIYYTGFHVAQLYGASYDRVQRAIDQSDSITAITLGNSHSGSIDWKAVELDGKGYNLHDGFFDIFEMLYVAEEIIPELTSLQRVFIAVPYYFFQFDNGAVDDQYQNSFRQRTYFMTPRLKLINGDWENYLMARVAPVVRPDHWKGVITPPILDALGDVVIERPIEQGITSEAYLKKHGQSRTDQNERQVSEMMEGHPNLTQDAKQAFEQLLELFAEHEVTVYLYTPPYHHYYTEHFDQVINEENQTVLYEILENHSVTYLDFSNDERFITNDSLFTDSDHLNHIGEPRFTKVLFDSLGL